MLLLTSFSEGKLIETKFHGHVPPTHDICDKEGMNALTRHLFSKTRSVVQRNDSVPASRSLGKWFSPLAAGISSSFIGNLDSSQEHLVSFLLSP